MREIIFSTGNSTKFEVGDETLLAYDIQLIQEPHDIDEIQSDDPEKIVKDKAARAFELIGKPLIVTDDSWSFSGLKGFPGAYMHYMNEWLSVEDFLRLTQPLEDRTATLTQMLTYTDGTVAKTFRLDSPGQILKEARGESEFPNHQIITLDGDNGLSIAEVHALKSPKKEPRVAQIWHKFGTWLIDQD